MDAANPPLSESYWVVPGRFLAGEHPTSHLIEAEARLRIDALLAAGIDTFFDLTEPDEQPPYLDLLQDRARLHGKSISYQRFPVLDRSLPEPAELQKILNAIDSILQEGHNLYLHCWGGVGRSGTVVGCYLVRQGLDGRRALEQIAQWWQSIPKRRFYPRSPETDEQVQYILNWPPRIESG